MVDDEAGVGVAVDQRGACVHVVPAQHVDREVLPYGFAQDQVDTRVARLPSRLAGHHDANADCARRFLPLGNDIGHRRICRIDRLNEGETVRMGVLHLDRITGVVLIHGKGGYEDRAVNADRIHRYHHLVASDMVGPVRYRVPGAVRRVGGIDMDLGINNGHGGGSSAHDGFLVLQQFAAVSSRGGRDPGQSEIHLLSTFSVIS